MIVAVTNPAALRVPMMEKFLTEALEASPHAPAYSDASEFFAEMVAEETAQVLVSINDGEPDGLLAATDRQEPWMPVGWIVFLYVKGRNPGVRKDLIEQTGEWYRGRGREKVWMIHHLGDFSTEAAIRLYRRHVKKATHEASIIEFEV